MGFLCKVLGVLQYPRVNDKGSGVFSLTFLVGNDDVSILDIITFAKIVGLDYFVIRDDNSVVNDTTLLDVDDCACVNGVDIKCLRVGVPLRRGVGIIVFKYMDFVEDVLIVVDNCDCVVRGKAVVLLLEKSCVKLNRRRCKCVYKFICSRVT